MANSTVKERLKEFLSHENLSQKKFEIRIGASNGFINNISKGIGADKLQRIVCEFPHLSQTWLLTGEGEMLVNPSPINNSCTSENDNSTEKFLTEIAEQRRLTEKALEQIEKLIELLAEK